MRFTGSGNRVRFLMAAVMLTACVVPPAYSFEMPRILPNDQQADDTTDAAASAKTAATAKPAAAKNVSSATANATKKAAASDKKVTPLTGWSSAQIKRSYMQMALGDYDNAIVTMVNALRREPNCAVMRRYLTYALLRRRAARAALDQLDAIQSLDGLVAYDQCMKGQALMMLGDTQKAVDSMKTASEMDPRNDYIRDRYIESLQVCGKYEDAAGVCANGFYTAKDAKMKGHYLAEFNQVQQALAYWRARGGFESTSGNASATPKEEQPTVVGQLDMQFGMNASSFGSLDKAQQSAVQTAAHAAKQSGQIK